MRGRAFNSELHMTQEEARPQIVREWKRWKLSHAGRDGTAMFIFFGTLQREQPHLLTFRYSGDKWQRVHGWLMNHEGTSD
jgi:hypothetical protein